MIKEPLLEALSKQVNAEYYSAYLYLIMSAECDRLGLSGFSNWLYVQAQEEMAHGTHIYEFILDRNEKPSFYPIELPQNEFADLKAIFEKVLSHEEHVTELINNIATLASNEGDHATYNFIMWYVDEQVEEESNADDLLTKVSRIGENNALLYTLDQELATRTFTDPFAGTETD